MGAPASNPSQPAVLLLDTNVLVIYGRQGEPFRRLEAQLGLQDGRAQGIVSVISIGEILALKLRVGFKGYAQYNGDASRIRF